MALTWDELLILSMTEQFMQALHSQLVSENGYFLHKARPKRLAKIVSEGLRPQRFEAVMPAWVSTAGFTGQLLFVTPGRSESAMNVTGETTLLAFPSSSLPAHIGLDWTFPDFLAIAGARFNRLDSVDPIRFVIDVMTEHSTVLCYDGVASSALRCWDGQADRTDPASWPALTG